MNDCFAHLFDYEYRGPDVIVRRYLDEAKFLDFARTSELYFAPASKFSDPEEGYFTLAEQRVRERELAAAGFNNSALNTARRSWDTVSRNNSKATLISCWTLGQDEDAQMWQEYGRNDRAVAIETTVEALRQGLGPDVFFAQMRYIERGTDTFGGSLYAHAVMPLQDSLEPFFHKDKAQFQWERELRVLAPIEQGQRLDTARRISLLLDQQDLRFVLAPGAGADRAAEVAKLVSKKNPACTIVSSQLA